jgi:hypothetical protein
MKDLQKKAVRSALAYRMGVPEWWLAVIYSIESGENPQAINPYTKAVGLIQFMPSTLKAMGYTTDQVYNMNYEQQSHLVFQYFFRYDPSKKSYVPKIAKSTDSLTNFYLTIFYPFAINQGPEYVLGSHVGPELARAIFNQNPGYQNAENRKLGVIRKKDITNYVKNQAKKLGYSDFEQFLSNLDTKISNLFK